MASVDPPERNRAFAESLGADFPILSDPSGEVARAYGVVDSGRSVARRWTFYIDPDGVVRRVDREVDPLRHGDAIAERLAELGFPLAPTEPTR
jgi:peroxiredoxin Q/BCP